MKKITSILLTTALALFTSALPAFAAPANQDISLVHKFSDGSIPPGSTSMLVTNNSGATATLRTSMLPAGHVITMWFVVFNHPENCSHPTPFSRCGEGDLFEPSVDASVAYGAGRIVNPNGEASYGAQLSVGDTSGALFGPGLINPTGADIHLVLHDHGSINTPILNEQLHSFGANCNNAPPGTGTPGDYTCVDLQFAVHEQ